jgi:hypothetical protein
MIVSVAAVLANGGTPHEDVFESKMSMSSSIGFVLMVRIDMEGQSQTPVFAFKSKLVESKRTENKKEALRASSPTQWYEMSGGARD